jgi:hypothetical protein
MPLYLTTTQLLRVTNQKHLLKQRNTPDSAIFLLEFITPQNGRSFVMPIQSNCHTNNFLRYVSIGEVNADKSMQQLPKQLCL